MRHIKRSIVAWHYLWYLTLWVSMVLCLTNDGEDGWCRVPGETKVGRGWIMGYRARVVTVGTGSEEL